MLCYVMLWYVMGWVLYKSSFLPMAMYSLSWSVVARCSVDVF